MDGEQEMGTGTAFVLQVRFVTPHGFLQRTWFFVMDSIGERCVGAEGFDLGISKGIRRCPANCLFAKTRGDFRVIYGNENNN